VKAKPLGFTKIRSPLSEKATGFFVFTGCGCLARGVDNQIKMEKAIFPIDREPATMTVS